MGDWLAAERVAGPLPIQRSTHVQLRSGKAHSRSLGFAPTASRGRRDDKGEGGASMEAWLVAERTARTLYVPMFRRTLI